MRAAGACSLAVVSDPPRRPASGGLGSQLLGPSSGEKGATPPRRREPRGGGRVSDLLFATGPSARMATPLPPPLEFGGDDAMRRRHLDGSAARKRAALAGLIWAAAVIVVSSRLLYDAGGLELFFPSPVEYEAAPYSVSTPMPEVPPPPPLAPEPRPVEPVAPAARPVVAAIPEPAAPAPPAVSAAPPPAPAALRPWLEERPPADPGYYYDDVEDVIVIGDRVSRDTLGEYMRISLTAQQGARLAVDGAEIGTAPIPDVLMAEGPHFFQTLREDGRVVEQLVEVDERTGRVEF